MSAVFYDLPAPPYRSYIPTNRAICRNFFGRVGLAFESEIHANPSTRGFENPLNDDGLSNWIATMSRKTHAFAENGIGAHFSPRAGAKKTSLTEAPPFRALRIRGEIITWANFPGPDHPFGLQTIDKHGHLCSPEIERIDDASWVAQNNMIVGALIGWNTVEFNGVSVRSVEEIIELK